MPWESDQFSSAYLKRPAPTVADRTMHKAAHVAKAEDTGEEWACPKCGNLNYAGRLVCNMRRCQAPRPDANMGNMGNSPAGGSSDEAWTCVNCGNENYQGRLFCNMRKCGHARPGLTAADVARATAVGGGLASNAPAATFAALTRNVPTGPPGSWKCIVCNNVNYPQRTTCNGQQGQCGLPRPAMDSKAMGAAAASNGAVPSVSATPSNGAGGQPPAGSWVCLACKNVNYPARTSCNARGCGLPRDEVDGGPPSANNGPQGGSAPVPTVLPRSSGAAVTAPAPVSAPGWEAEAAAAGWVAPTTLPASSGAGTGAATPAAPEGSWVCPACQNVNWPTRTVCNKRTCGLPRSV